MTGLSEQRRRLLDKLLAEADVARGPDRVPRRDGDRATAPLSPGQQRLYLAEQNVPGSLMLVGTGAVRLRGELDVELFRRGLDVLVDRHEMLRTAVVESPHSGAPEARIHPPGTVRLDLAVREITDDETDAAIAAAAAQPFDLTRAPLLRPMLLRITDAPGPVWVLTLSMHHIAIDAWSIGILLREFGEVYRALADGRAPDLPEPEVGYGDFAAWQLGRVEQQDAQLSYWRHQLDGVPTVDLPTDRARPARRSYAGDTVALELSPRLNDQVRALADTSGATTFGVLVAAWSLVLSRFSGCDDVVVGTPVAGRTRAELANVVGFFVNTLPLRVTVAPEESFRVLLGRTQRVCADAFEHQDVPFERIVGGLDLERDVSGQTTLVRHWLAMNNNAWTVSWPGVEAEIVPDDADTVRCDLSVQLTPTVDGGLTGRLEYSTELFDAGSVARLATAFTALLVAAADRPDSAVGALVADVERADLRALPGPVPQAQAGHPDLARWFEATATATPEAVALVGGLPRTEMTYVELDQHAERVARLLTARGVGDGDVVGLHLERGPDLVAALLAVFKVGAVAWPIPPDLPRRRLETLRDLARPALVLSAADLAADTDGHRPDAAGRAPDTGGADRERAAYLLFTSGSTGTPKGVLATHAGLLNRLAGMRDQFAVGPGDRVLAKASTGFDVSLWELLLPLVTGATVVLARPDGHRDVEHLHELITAEGVTVCHFVPSLLEEFVRADGPAAPRLRLLLSGGERLTRRLAEAVLARWPQARLVNQYGPTETVIDVTSGEVRAPVGDVVPIGRPVAGTELLVLDRARNPVPPGVPGELHVGGVQVSHGYLRAPQETARRFVAHPSRPGERLYATGDRVRWLADGSLDFLGRVDDQIKVRGHRIEPGEIETVLRDGPGVVDVRVRAVTTDPGHAQLVAYVLAPGGDAELPSVLTAFAADRLPATAVPGRVVVLDRWPVTASGKVDVRSLDVGALADATRHRDRQRPDEPPRGAVETELGAIWAELLGLERVGRNASFAALGGHSLLAIRAVGRIRAAFGTRVRIGEFFDAADLADLAALIEARLDSDGDTPPEPAVTRSGADRADDAPIPRLDRG